MKNQQDWRLLIEFDIYFISILVLGTIIIFGSRVNMAAFGNNKGIILVTTRVFLTDEQLHKIRPKYNLSGTHSRTTKDCQVAYQGRAEIISHAKR